MPTLLKSAIAAQLYKRQAMLCMTPFSIYLSLCRSRYTLLDLCACLLSSGPDNWLCTVGVRPIKERENQLLRYKKNSAAQSAMLPTSPLEKSHRVICPLYSPGIPGRTDGTFPFLPSEFPALSLSFHMETPQSLSPLAHTAVCHTTVANQRWLGWSWRKTEIFVSFVR